MNKGLVTRILIQLEPSLAQEFGLAIAEDEKKLKALEIIRNYGYFDEQGDLIVHLPTNRKEEHELLKKVLL